MFAHAQAPLRPESQIGRYQIVVGPSGTGDDPQVYKLDTVTGKTWKEAFLMDKGQKTMVFGVIQDYPGPRDPVR